MPTKQLPLWAHRSETIKNGLIRPFSIVTRDASCKSVDLSLGSADPFDPALLSSHSLFPIIGFQTMKNPIPNLLSKLAVASCLLLSSPLYAGYHLTFNDEFDSFDSSRWQTSDYWGQRTNGGDYQDQWFSDPNTAPSGFTAYNPFIPSGSGTLTIRAQPTPAGNYSYGLPYVSGQLTTAHKFTQRYGYFELRAKLPPGKGLWSRFWLLTDDGAWPGEYDIFEVLGKENPVTVHQTTHYRNATSSRGVDGFAATNINPVDGNFHTYGFHWTPETVTWYVDGQPTLSQVNRINIPMYTLIDLVVGKDPNNWWPGNPDATTPWPANMELDYFRVYSNDPSLPRVTLPSGTSHAAPPAGSGITFIDTQPTTQQLPAGWTAGDIGPVFLSGSSAWNSNTGEWMVKGAGYGVGGWGDQCQFAGTSLSGDGGVVATVRNVTAMNDNDVRAGVMIRETTGDKAREIALLSSTAVNKPTTANSLVLVSRSATDGLATTLATVPNVNAPVSLRIMRTGNSFTPAYSTDDGLTWTTVGSPQTLAMGSTVRAGLAVAGHSSVYFRLSRSIFSNVTVGQLAPVLTASATSAVTGQTLQFGASLIHQLTGSPSATGTVTWSVASGGGTMDSGGTYTAPAVIGTGKALIKAVFGSYTVTRPIEIILPSPWTMPGLHKTPPGDAGFTSNTWTILGGGEGISTIGKEDSYRSVSSTMDGNDTLTVKVTSSNATQAGLVIRDTTAYLDNFAGARGRYAGIWRTPTGLQWATRETDAGNAASRTVNTITTLPIWLRIERSGASSDVFKAFYSTNGTTFTQLGSTRTFPMSLPATVGLAVASGDASTNATATFSDLSMGTNSSSSPTIATAASATPSPVTGNTTTLSVLGADDTGEAGLNYSWSSSGPAPVTFSINHTNAAKNAVATFTRAGSYTLSATLTDEGGLTTSSNVNVIVNQVLSGITVSPATVSVSTNATQQLIANGIDQFGQTMTTSATWSVTSGGGLIDSSTGLYTAPASIGTAVVTAVAGSLSSTSAITISVSSALPSPWSGIDINATPSGNESVIDDIWTINSGGTGLEHTFTSDSLRFVDRVLDGDGTIIARLTSRSTTAGVMFRESNANGASYAAVWLNWKGVQWVTREGTNTYSALRSPTVLNTYMPVWLKVVRSGNGYTGSYSYDGAAWTQLGARTFTMNSSAFVGLAVGNGSATFSDVSVTPTVNTAPTVANPAAANPSPVTGTTTNLSVLGADNVGEPALSYTWSATGPAGVTFSADDTNAAKNTTATFSQAGSYELTATLTDAGGLTTTSSIQVTVNQTASSVALSPPTTHIVSEKTQQFTVTAHDQFGTTMTSQPAFTWSVSSGGGTISSSGVYTAPAVAASETAVIQVMAASYSATSTVTIAPRSTLPSPWAETSINATPAGETSVGNGNWIITAGGTGIEWYSYADSFHYVSRPSNGDGQAMVRLTNPGTTTEAGLMFRESPNNDARYAGIFITTQGNTSGLAWMTRETTGAYSILHSSPVPVTGPVWLKLVRTGDTFTASYSSDGVVWTQLSPARTFAMNASALVGLAVSGGNTITSATAAFSDFTVNLGPSVATPAAATSVTGNSTALSVLGGDDAGEPALYYNWSATGPATVTYSINETHISKNTTATFTQAGSYTFTATLTDAGGLTATSSVVVEVGQSLSSITVAPAAPSVLSSTTLQFTATAYDQFGTAMATAPTFTWGVLSGGGTILSSGLFTAPLVAISQPTVVQASAGGSSGTSTVTITPPGTLPSPWTAADINTTLVGDSSESIGNWTLTGSGTGLSWSVFTDSFRYVNRPYTGNGTAIVRLTNRGTATQAGLMFRDSTTNASRYAGILFTTQGVNPGLGWITREGATGDYTSLRTPTVPVSLPVWLKLTRVGNTFTAAYSSDGTLWTQLGSARTFNMNATALVGMAVSSGNAGSSATATFSDFSVNPSPTVVTSATATPSPVSGNTTALSILGADDTGEAALNYTWTATGPAPVAFSSNGTNSAKNATATFTTAGTYNLLATITNAQGLSVTSAVTVTVNGLFTATNKIGSFNPTASASVSGGIYTVTSAGSLASGSSTDNFYYYNLQVTGDADLVARVASMSNTGSTARGGLMIRGSTTNNAVSSGIFTTAASGIQALARTTAGANSVGTTVAGPTRPHWLKVSRRGSTFTTYNSADGVTWTLVRTDTIPTMPGTAHFGLVAARNSNNSTNVVVFDNVSLQLKGPPTIATPASAAPAVVTGMTTTLGALGMDDSGESSLSYAWATIGATPASVNFSSNGSNAAKTTTATFQKAGNYYFEVTITDGDGLSTTNSVNVTVVQTLTSNPITPATTSVNSGETQQFTTIGYDQFSNMMADQPTFTWSLASGVGSISESGLYIAPNVQGSANVRASHGSINGTAAVSVIGAMSPFDTWMNAYPSLTESDKAASADPDGDGACNLLEYALSGVPDNGANRGYQVSALEDTDSNGQQEFTLTFAVRNNGGSPTFSAGAGGVQSTVVDGIQYTIQGSADLIFPSGAVSETPVPTGLPPLPSGYEYRRFHLNDSEGLSGKGFLRVQVESNP